ncbi:MAG TPA: phytanoyl-CoA dioxygenase family protein [Candidatus Acidoferrum sp.]|nr:phytanoyl-CoA dioxygenase family protein [Candidatus Acidoferrum sp.]
MNSRAATLKWAEGTIQQGFAIIPDVVQKKETERLLEDLECASLPRSRAGVRHAMRIPGVAEMARGAELLGIAREILGEGAFPFRATLFEKSPTANWLVVWHQDTALPLRERRETSGWGPWSVKDGVHYAHAPASALEQVLALRVHLDDSTIENGPLRVLPGTHTLGVLTDEDIHELSIKVPEAECLVPRGGALAMRPLIVHASSKAQNDKPRRVLHIEYSSAHTLSDKLEVAIA